MTFSQFLQHNAANGELVNTFFEERFFSLVNLLQRITGLIDQQGLRYQVIGGMAVLIYVEEVNPEFTPLTRNVDLMINRADLDQLIVAAEKDGFRFQHAAGADMFVFGGTYTAIHLNYFFPTPALNPVQKIVQGQPIMVAPLIDLLSMKLTSNRDKDRVHVRALDAAGLIEGIEGSLIPDLARRLHDIRQSE